MVVTLQSVKLNVKRYCKFALNWCIIDSMEDEARVTVRFPADLYQELKDRAKENRRSLNNEILVLLERFIQSKEVVYSSEASEDKKREPPDENVG